MTFPHFNKSQQKAENKIKKQKTSKSNIDGKKTLILILKVSKITYLLLTGYISPHLCVGVQW